MSERIFRKYLKEINTNPKVEFSKKIKKYTHIENE